jgi:hypothetical protein
LLATLNAAVAGADQLVGGGPAGPALVGRRERPVRAALNP